MPSRLQRNRKAWQDFTHGYAVRRPVGYVSINGHLIRRNVRDGSNLPPIRIARSWSDAKPRYASEVKINGPSRLVYTPQGRILKCGARLVLEAALDDIEIVK